MKVTSLEIDFKFRLQEMLDGGPAESSEKTVTLGENGPNLIWQLACWDIPIFEHCSLEVRQLNHRDVVDKDIVVFGRAHLSGVNRRYSELEFEQSMELPVVRLQGLVPNPSGRIWEFNEDLRYEYVDYFTFRANISVVYCEVTKIQRDFSDLLASGLHSDLVLVCDEGMSFKVHKGVLSARSEVFRGMFASGMKEELEGRVDIREVGSQVLGEMLRFIYSGRLEQNVIEDTSMLGNLYVVADRYDVADLKKMVVDVLLNGLTPENVNGVLALAERFADLDDLKQKCLKLIQDISEEEANRRAA